MATDHTTPEFESDDHQIGAAVSYEPPDGGPGREDGAAELFDFVDDAREWAERYLRNEKNTALHFRVDIAHVEPDDFDGFGDWFVDPDRMIARAEWDSATNTVRWQEKGPFTWDD
ncbi:hypothetical protein [Nocardia wallacei]|uniref:hypothetical protein n=1 Tax=Nocardia wallacei TaxID=480035 RepID=UPI00245707E9|nr:hypothetical protein [Nocardia wallacei]